jgi:hypothetical protein
LLEVRICENALGHIMPDARYSNPGQASVVRVAGMIVAVRVARSHNLTAIVRPAKAAHKVRELRLVALGALDRRNGIELPICRPAATRLGSGGFPLKIRHRRLPLPGSHNRRPDSYSARRSCTTRGIPHYRQPGMGAR